MSPDEPQQPNDQPQPQPPDPVRGWSAISPMGRVLAVVGGFIALFILLGIIGSIVSPVTRSTASSSTSHAPPSAARSRPPSPTAPKPTKAAAPKPTAPPSAVPKPTAPAPVPKPTAPAPAPKPAAAPEYTASQQQAIAAAEGYLSDGQGFSYQGLIDQLDSPYGNGFSEADATFAVNHVQVDWNQQAVIAANGYMNDGQGFSCSGLVEQLDSPYGNQFTQAQAEYAARSVGLGSC